MVACCALSPTTSWALEVGSRAGSRLRPYVLPFEPEAIRAPQTWLVATPSSSQCGIIVLAAELCDFLDFWLDGSRPPYPPLSAVPGYGGVSAVSTGAARCSGYGGGEVFLGGEGLRR